MTRTAFLKKYFLRFAVALTLVSLIVYVLYHVFGSSADRLMRTPVRKISDEQILSGQAYLFRNENVLTVDRAGPVNDLAVSGEKVSKGVSVTEVWKGSEAWSESLQLRLDSLNRVIAALEKGSLPADTPLSKTESLQTALLTDYLTICQSVKDEDWSRLPALEDALLINLNQYASITGGREAIAEALEKLLEERAALLGDPYATVTNDQASGYFYNRACVDGYETILSADALENLSADRFFDLIAREPVSLDGAFAVGKMAYGHDWYLGISFAAGAERWFSVGGEYTFRLPENGGMELTMTCTQVHLHEDGRVVAVFASADHPASLQFLRSQQVEITVARSNGYYVPEAALRTVDGVEGVYIFKDSTVYFRRIEVLYRGDGYCIVSEQNGRENYLALYDLLVTSGDDLYDGRVFQ